MNELRLEWKDKNQGSFGPDYVMVMNVWTRGWQLKFKGRDRFDVLCKSKMQSFGNWLDAEGEREGRIYIESNISIWVTEWSIGRNSGEALGGGGRDSLRGWAFKLCNVLCEEAIRREATAGSWKKMWNLEESRLEMRLLVSSVQWNCVNLGSEWKSGESLERI